MADPSKPSCPGCAKRDRRIVQLEAQIAAILKRVEQLKAELAKAKKNFRNSSRPPSSDIVSAKKRKSQHDHVKNHKMGGQAGRRRHERTAIPEDQSGHHWEWRYDACPCCGGSLEDVGEPRVRQQNELREISATVEQHDFPQQRCVHCDKIFSLQISDGL